MPTAQRLTERPHKALVLGAFVLVVNVFAGGLAGCSGDRTPIVLYSPHGRDLLELVERAYEADHPDVDVRWLDMGSQEVYDRVRSERANPQGDVWFGGPDTILARGAAEGLLAAHRPGWADNLPAESRHDGDFYFGLYRAVPILLYNSSAVPDAEAPADFEDLLDPRWTGKVLIRDPLASGTMRTAFGLILARSVVETGSEEAGLEWLRRLDAQTSDYVVNPALLFEKIIRQEGLVTIWELTDALLLQQREAPIGYRFPSGGTPVIDDAVGLIANAPHAEAAKAFIEWVGGERALGLVAREAYRLPARRDLPDGTLPEWAEKALAEIRPAEVDWSLIAERGQKWMQRWDREVRNKG